MINKFPRAELDREFSNAKMNFIRELSRSETDLEDIKYRFNKLPRLDGTQFFPLMKRYQESELHWKADKLTEDIAHLREINNKDFDPIIFQDNSRIIDRLENYVQKFQTKESKLFEKFRIYNDAMLADKKLKKPYFKSYLYL